MQTIILNGAGEGDLKVDEASEIVASLMRDKGPTEILRLRDMEMADCKGCFGCWITTPGQCVIDDAARPMADKLGPADLKVFVTSVVFGGYSYQLKKALDRQISTLLPFVRKNEQGEVHHPSRYSDKKPYFLVIGVLPEKDPESEAIFRGLVERNSLNMHSKAYGTAIIYLKDSKEVATEKIREAASQGGINE